MNKDTFYFSHDAGARNDERILIIRSEFGWEGYGWYFAICELFRESTDFTLSKNVVMLQLCLNITSSNFKAFIEKCFGEGLFSQCENDKTRFYSESFMRRMELINEKSSKRAAAGRLGGLARAANLKKKTGSVSKGAKRYLKQKRSKPVASKEKEIKEKEIKENSKPLTPFESLFEKWRLFRKQIKKPIHDASAEAALKALEKLSNNDIKTAEAIVDQSIANGWQGLFALKNNNKNDVQQDPAAEAKRLLEKNN